MPDTEKTAIVNRIVAALPEHERTIVEAKLEKLDLPVRFMLYELGKPIEYVYFIATGVGSLMTPMKDGPSVELATVGSEGMVGMPLFLGGETTTTSRAFMQVNGWGFRMRARDFQDVLGQCPELNKLLLRYAQALMTQMAQNAACNRTHGVEERCARWLLMTRERVQGDTFELTQEFIAQMLGVRRPTVSIAAGILAQAGLISYVRGRITILDRDGLEEAACECYQIIRNEFERLVGSAGGS